MKPAGGSNAEIPSPYRWPMRAAWAAAAATAAAALAVALSAEAGNPGVDPGAGLPADPARLAAIAVFAGLCVTLAVLGFRVHALRSANRCLEARVEELCDENWELSDAEEHAKSVVEAQRRPHRAPRPGRLDHLRERRVLRAGGPAA